MALDKDSSLIMQGLRIELEAKKQARLDLIGEVRELAPNVSIEHIDDVLDALWLLEKLD